MPMGLRISGRTFLPAKGLTGETMMTRQDELRNMVKLATSGPWNADGPVWNLVVYSSLENRICFMAHSNGLNDDRDIANSRLIAQAPTLATDLAAALDEVARLDRDRRLAEAQVDRLLALSTSMDTDFEKFLEAVQALGAMPEGYCFCSRDRIGDDSKTHEPECADIRALMKGR